MTRVVVTARTMSTTSPLPNAGVPAARGKSILLSASVGFLMGPDNSAAAVLSRADPRPTVVVYIHLLIVYQVCAIEFDVAAVATATILWTGLAGSGVAFVGHCAFVGVGVKWIPGAGGVVCCTVYGFCLEFACSCFLGVCCPAITAATRGSDILVRRVDIVAGVHMSMVFTATVLRTSLVRSTI